MTFPTYAVKSFAPQHLSPKWLAPLSDTLALCQPPLTTAPRSRSILVPARWKSWRARLGVLASRGETDGPRVAEARAALSWWRRRTFLIKELDITPERADSLLDLIEQHPETETAVTR